jgi:hypothetical protein
LSLQKGRTVLPRCASVTIRTIDSGVPGRSISTNTTSDAGRSCRCCGPGSSADLGEVFRFFILSKRLARRARRAALGGVRRSSAERRDGQS